MIGVVGAGAWGTALAQMLASDGRDVLIWARSGAMGNTSSLSERELDALEAYLRSL